MGNGLTIYNKKCLTCAANQVGGNIQIKTVIVTAPTAFQGFNDFCDNNTKINKIFCCNYKLERQTNCYPHVTLNLKISIKGDQKHTEAIRRLSQILLDDLENGTPQSFSMRDREIIARCWRKYISGKRTDIFHKTMLKCIEASPKLNEIIACGRYCYRDLRKWPKLNKICQSQFKFYEKLIYELNMDQQKILIACYNLGRTHAEYSRYGMKPHFLDIFQQQLLGQIACIEYENSKEMEETIIAFIHFNNLIIESFLDSYSQRTTEIREQEKIVEVRLLEEIL